MSSGGYWDKIGNRFEDCWALHQLVLMTASSSDIESLEREPVGDDEKGVDLWVNLKDGTRECHQCKRANGNKSNWSMASLRQEKVFLHLHFQISRDLRRHRYCFVSRTDAPGFDRLCEEACNSRDMESFFADQVLSFKSLRQDISEIFESLNLTIGDLGDRQQVWSLLRKSRFKLFRDDKEQRRQMADQLGSRIDGDPIAALESLETWLRQQLRRKINVEDVALFLENRGYRLTLGSARRGEVVLDALTPAMVRPGLERLQERFFESVRHHLAGGRLINRKETREVRSLLDQETTRIVVVHGIAGSGKSGVLFELADEFVKQGVPFLPIRLDRYQEQLKGDPKCFAVEALGIPGSPGRSLAAVSFEKSGILLLDQLDAIRWTAAHSSEAWDVCREIISEALTAGLKIVVCCRTFDLEHDPQLRGWEQETQNLRRVEVQLLHPEDVRAVIERTAKGSEILPDLRAKHLDLLRLIHRLQMWLTIYGSTKEAPNFDTSWNLMNQFWANRLDELAKEGIPRRRVEEIEIRFVKALDDGAVLTAPVRKLGMTEKELNNFQHQHLIQVDFGRGLFAFCHQSYQDYLIAKHLLGTFDQCTSAEGGHKFIAWLGDRDVQSLFRREQLRLLLGALRAENHRMYYPTIEVLLPNSPPDRVGTIRFHLRLLTLQALGQVLDPRPDEANLVLALLDQIFWREHVIGEVIRGQVPWFELLDDRGILAVWLSEEGQRSQELALETLLHVVEKCGNRVARLLLPYSERNTTWTRRILSVLRFDPSEDSDSLFELRLHLVKQGAYTADHVGWDRLAERHPNRFLLLAVHVLMALADSLSRGEERPRRGRRTEIDWRGLEKVSYTVLPREHWAVTWEMIFRALTCVVRAGRASGEPTYILESYAIRFEALMPVLFLLKNLASALLEEGWLGFVTIGEELSRSDRLAEVIFLYCLIEGPVSLHLADWVLNWLMADSWRARLQLRSNAGRWSLSGLLIERYSPVSSLETYQRLEQWLLDYREPDFFQRYKWRHENIGGRGNLEYPSCFGRTPHHLLPRLPMERRSAAVESRIKELARKFPPSASSEKMTEVTVGWGGSPLTAHAKAVMTDGDWLSIATNDRLPARSGRVRFKGGHFEETSIETLSSEFRSMTQQQPERFAKLALRLPSTAAPAFFKAILAGLAWPGESPGEAWEPPSVEILEKVLGLVPVRDLVASEDQEAASSFCQVLERYCEYPWSDGAIRELVWIAQHHSDPVHGYFPVGSCGGSDHRDDLEINALNVTRGRAGLAIRTLLFARPALLADLQPALESLIRDEHPAVRVASLAACLPVINIDRDLAVEWFLRGCDGPDAVLATREVRDFLRYTEGTHLCLLRSLILRMADSQFPRVATAGATRIAVCFLVEGELEEEFERCVTGTQPQRKGIAKVAASLLGQSEFAERAKAALLRLAQDEDEEVAAVVARSFEELDLHHIKGDRDAWNAFARSKAFQADPSPLLRALDDQSGDLLPFADCLLAVGTTFAEELAEASQNMATGISGDARQLLPLLLRLYEQAKDRDVALYLRCLDLWDRLLERRVGAAMGLTKELDRM